MSAPQSGADWYSMEGTFHAVRRVSQQGAAVSSACASDRPDDRLLLLARKPGSLPVGPARGSVRPEIRFRRPRQLPGDPVQSGLPAFAEGHGGLQSRDGPVVYGSRAPAGHLGRPRGAGTQHLSYASDLALCGRPRRCRHALALHVQSGDGNVRLHSAPERVCLGSAPQWQPGDVAGHRCGGLEAD
ncbi:hypothetical protein D9M72_395380 [compost metagenome]